MNRNTSLLIKPIGILFVAGIALRLVTVMLQPFPLNLDEAYYTVNAQTLAAGGGFSQSFIWQYLDAPENLPQASNRYWMPLSSIIAWPGMAIKRSASETARASATAEFAYMKSSTWSRVQPLA